MVIISSFNQRLLLKPFKLSYHLRYLNIGIRREEKGRWECRVPLTPNNFSDLKRSRPDFHLFVQPCTKRVFTNQEYEKVGAVIQDDLSNCDLILGVKEVPIKSLIADKTFIFFSHCHKGQRHNMKMLNEIMQKKISLIDYELMVNEANQRLVAFGGFAGFAGMMNCFSGFGNQLLSRGYRTPFLNIGLAHNYLSLASCKNAVVEIGREISQKGLPAALGPIVFAFTGNGNVTKGALEMFKLLPHEMVSVEDLPGLVKSKNFATNKVYGVIVTPKEYLSYSGEFQMEEFLVNPSKFQSHFHESVAPFASVLVNGIYWDAKFPRLLTRDHIRTLAKENRLRLLSIADISCDIGGSLEFMDFVSTIDNPYFLYDPLTDKKNHESFGKGIQIMSIDNLPTQIPMDSSEHFGNCLVPLLKDYENSKVLIKASIVKQGVLSGRFSFLQQILMENILYGLSSPSKPLVYKNILVLGSGYVSGPLIDYLSNIPDSSNSVSEANLRKGNKENVSVLELNVSDREHLNQAIKNHDVIVSFVPAAMHPVVAQSCIENKKHMVTASYVSPSLSELDSKASNAGITILNELGLDPGIDHLAAMQVFEQVKAEGGKIISFVSWCGGLPAPENSGNPFGYKFSWSPKGALLAALNSAKYLENGKIVEIEGENLLSSAKHVSILPGFNFEGIPNRDSTKYAKLYGIEDASTIFRGTLRYKGFCELLDGFKELGFMSKQISEKGNNWKEVFESFVHMKSDETIQACLSRKLNNSNQEKVNRLVEAIDWLELRSEHQKVTRHPGNFMIDSFCEVLQKKLQYQKGERDLIVLQHKFLIQNKDGTKVEKTMNLVLYGEQNGYSAMAKTVGLPAALGTELIMKGEIQKTGVITPMSKEIYTPILGKLNENAIIFEDHIAAKQ